MIPDIHTPCRRHHHLPTLAGHEKGASVRAPCGVTGMLAQDTLDVRAVFGVARGLGARVREQAGHVESLGNSHCVRWREAQAVGCAGQERHCVESQRRREFSES